uniref:site-specific DNA-methyltransferase n=1 Tax=Acetobacter aceti TaxID=435 RepID=UPI000C07A76D
ARELLAETGSVFVQISDDNLHHVREVLDEVFGAENFCSIISFNKTSGFSPKLLSNVADYLIWYAKDIKNVKYQQIYLQKELGEEGATQYTYVESADRSLFRSMTADEQSDPRKIPRDYRILTHGDMSAQGTSGNTEPFEFNGKVFRVPANCHWKTTPAGMLRLAENNRLLAMGNSLRYKRYLSDFPLFPVSNIWTDMGTSGFAAKKLYTVQTNPAVVQRCMLMTTEPGDLVLDITCGSGTTALVAENWGRRWITCDTSRVPIALARQRLLTSTFSWYKLKEPVKGPSGGFVYERKRNNRGEEVGGLIPRITLKSIAHDEDPRLETISERAEVNDKITRVCGPFTVEATIQAAMNMEEDSSNSSPQPTTDSPRAYLDRMIEVLRQSKTLNLPGNITVELETVSPLADREYLHAEGVARNGTEKRIAIVFGPEDGAIGSEYVFNAQTEALRQGYSQLFLFGFAIDANARGMLAKLKLPTIYIAVTPDVVMSDLLKTSRSSEIFSITGLPDVRLEAAGKNKDGTPLHRVVIKGLDIFRPDTMETDEVKAENLPCWMLDTNYNGMAFFASQVFFPKTSAWDNLQKSLKGQFAENVWEHLAGTVSEPFTLGDKRRIAVKVIDERGNELMTVKTPGDDN